MESFEKQLSPELVECKQELLKITESFTALRDKLKFRSDEGFNPLIDDNSIDKMSKILSKFNELGSLTDSNLKDVLVLVKEQVQVVDEIGQYSSGGGLNDDPENLQGIIWNLAEIMERSKDMEHVFRKVQNDQSNDIADTYADLGKVTLQKAELLHDKLEALQRYLQ